MSFEAPTLGSVVDFVASIGGLSALGKFSREHLVEDVVALHQPPTGHVLALSWWNGRAPVPDAWQWGVLIASPDDNFKAVEDTARGVGFTIFHRHPRFAMAKVLDRFFRGYNPPFWQARGAEVQRESASLLLSSLNVKEQAILAERFGQLRFAHGERCRFGSRRAGVQLAISAGAGFNSGQALVWDREAKKWFEFPHLYGVRIGDDVTIGVGSTIQRGILHDTVIGNDVKIGQSVNVGHGCEIGDHTVIAAHACLGGSVIVGDHVEIGMGAILRNGIRVGDGARIGMGAVVVEDVTVGCMVFGNPARVRQRPVL